MTPLHRSLAEFGEKNVQPDESYQNKCGEYVDAYVQAIKEAGNLWGVPVIDFNSVTGMNPMIEEQLIYFYDSGYDRLHPNTNGQERIAHTLMYQFISLPASFLQLDIHILPFWKSLSIGDNLRCFDINLKN